MKIYIILFVILAGLGGVWYKMNYDQNRRIEELIQDSTKKSAQIDTLKETITINNDTVDKLQLDYSAIKQAYSDIETEFNLYRMYGNEVKEKLNSHDLNNLALKKPELIEKILNGASKDNKRCFELLSGSPKTAAELAAKNEKEFNSECPWLF